MKVNGHVAWKNCAACIFMYSINRLKSPICLCSSIAEWAGGGSRAGAQTGWVGFGASAETDD